MNKLILIIILSLVSSAAWSKKVSCTYSNYETLGFNKPLSAYGKNVDMAVQNVLNLCLRTICATVHKQTQSAVFDLKKTSNEELEALLRFIGTPEGNIQKTMAIIQASDHIEPEDLVCIKPTMGELIYMDTMCRTSTPLIRCTQ